MTLSIVIEQPDDLLRDRGGVAEGYDNASPLAEQFFGVPVGRGNDCLARADSVGKCARDDLLTVKVRCDIDISRADELHQFLEPNKLVVEDDRVLDTVLSGKPLEHQTIGLAISPPDVRVC